MSENKLQVKNLRISFRTVSGKLQAVRNISFDLAKGETLAIVGESGSGKSVTSKAIIGILAGNSIVEGGEIIYDGKDLLKISEDEFYRIRGDKIAMIFQDPLSSLNPIMKIGRQLTEAMILKGKARQKSSEKELERMFSALRKYMGLAGIPEGRIKSQCDIFNRFEQEHIRLEGVYDDAFNAATEASGDIENAMFLIEKSAFDKDAARMLTNIVKYSELSVSKYVVDGEDADKLMSAAKIISKQKSAAVRSGNYSDIGVLLKEIHEILVNALAKPKPNFFAMGYYLVYSNEPLPDMNVNELNVFLRRYLDDNFMLAFIDDARAAVKYGAEHFTAEQRDVVEVLRKAVALFDNPELSREEMHNTVSTCIKEVEESLDELAISKDSQAYTFSSSIKSAVSIYFNGKSKNVREERRYKRQKAKYDRLAAAGKKPEWTLTPASIVDLDLAKNNIKLIIENLLVHYTDVIAAAPRRNYEDETVAIIDWLKLNAAGSVHKVSHGTAKHRALKLMEEVGISEPYKRFKQYPFEFSGGMRQRIVIAIALAADPDILICDEPTTALDVTIQAQILELINKIKKERNLSIIFITHDLGVVANMADKVAVMYAGKIVEYGTADDVFYRPAHPYTWALLSSMPDLDTNEKLEAIPGTPPNMIFPPKGDAFAARNKYAMKIDFVEEPPMFEISDTHSAATWLLHPDAPKVEMPRIVTDRINRMCGNGGGANE